MEPGAPGHTPVAEPDPRAAEETATRIHGDPTWPDESERPDGSSDQSEQEKEDDGDSGGFSLTARADQAQGIAQALTPVATGLRPF